MKIKSNRHIINRSKPAEKTPQDEQKSSQEDQVSPKQYQQAIRERQRLKSAEHAAHDPVKTHLKQRGELVGRRIAQFQRKNPGK